MKNQSIKFIIAVIGFIFGFSSTVAAQYGVPPNKYRIKGIVLSEKDNAPIKNIKVNVKTSYQTRVFSTNDKGEFSFKLYENDLKDTLYISAIDSDGDTNGVFQKKDTMVILKDKDVTLYGKKDKEFISGENTSPFLIHLKNEALKPKKQKKK